MLPVNGTSRRSRTTRLTGAVAIIAIATTTAVAGCASGTAGRDDDTGPQTANGVFSTGPALPSTELVRVTGSVVAGTQPGCLLLDTGFTRYVLIGGDQDELARSEEDEEEITVTGQAHTPTPTACTGGVPLEIDNVVPAT